MNIYTGKRLDNGESITGDGIQVTLEKCYIIVKYEIEKDSLREYKLWETDLTTPKGKKEGAE